MNQYHKIDSIYKRDMSKPNAPFIVGEWANPLFGYLAGNTWEWTEKVDGTNIRIMIDGDSITFGGKSDNAQIPSHLVTKLQELFLPIQARLKIKQTFGEEIKRVCLYGEGFGFKIQGKVGVDYLTDKVDFYLFDVNIGGMWLERKDVTGIGTKLGLTLQKVVSYGSLDDAISLVKKGFPSAFGNAQAEGLVLRPMVEIQDKQGHRVITKIKVRDFTN